MSISLADAVQRKTIRRRKREDVWRREALHAAWQRSEEGQMTARAIEVLRSHMMLRARQRVVQAVETAAIGDTILWPNSIH